MIPKLPKPPYYAVIFTSIRTAADENYARMSDHMVNLAKQQPGYLGYESYRNHNGQGCTISYWKAESDITRWKSHAEHTVAQELGKQKWYEDYVVRVAKIERHYGK